MVAPEEEEEEEVVEVVVVEVVVVAVVPEVERPVPQLAVPQRVAEAIEQAPFVAYRDQATPARCWRRAQEQPF